MNDKRVYVESLLQAYPENLLPSDVARFLNISRSSVYNLMKQESFPSFKLPGSRLNMTFKYDFISWYLNESSHSNSE